MEGIYKAYLNLKINKYINKMYLVYVHIGKKIPNTIYDSIYQTLYIAPTHIYILIDISCIEEFKQNIKNWNLEDKVPNYSMFINILPVDIFLKDNKLLNEYEYVFKEKYPHYMTQMNEFWMSTTKRFFILEQFMYKLHLTNVVHIENDVMLYTPISDLYTESFKGTQLCMVEDSPNRVIPSIMYIDNPTILNKLCKHLYSTFYVTSQFMNDMKLLGTFQDNKLKKLNPLKYDGAAIGQYLGGIDPIHIKKEKEHPIYYLNNPTKGFINETAILKVNNYTITDCITHFELNNSKIHNLHIHSKQLYQFSSRFRLNYNDIISGDRIVQSCDIIFTSPQISHKNVERYAKLQLNIKDFNNVNINKINHKILQLNKNNVKLFVYTHIMKDFLKSIWPYLITVNDLNVKIKYNVYCHNSDHSFCDEKYINKLDRIDFLNSDKLNKCYVQNINSLHPKLKLLPIGIANACWKHGNLITLYETLRDTYKLKKTKGIYINLNPNTYFYRKHVLNNLPNNFTNSTNLPYDQYLHELAKHKYCLCVRGNGIDTHRLWESLYLGVIPIIINNDVTNCYNHYKQLKELIPIYEIKNISELNEIKDISEPFPFIYDCKALHISEYFK